MPTVDRPVPIFSLYRKSVEEQKPVVIEDHRSFLRPLNDTRAGEGLQAIALLVGGILTVAGCYYVYKTASDFYSSGFGNNAGTLGDVAWSFIIGIPLLWYGLDGFDFSLGNVGKANSSMKPQSNAKYSKTQIKIDARLAKAQQLINKNTDWSMQRAIVILKPIAQRAHIQNDAGREEAANNMICQHGIRIAKMGFSDISAARSFDSDLVKLLELTQKYQGKKWADDSAEQIKVLRLQGYETLLSKAETALKRGITNYGSSSGWVQNIDEAKEYAWTASWVNLDQRGKELWESERLQSAIKQADVRRESDARLLEEYQARQAARSSSGNSSPGIPEDGGTKIRRYEHEQKMRNYDWRK